MSVKKISKLKFGGGDTSKMMQSVFDKLNEIIDSVNKQTGYDRSLAEGKPGDIRVRRKTGIKQVNEYSLEIRTDDGWASVDIELNKE